MKHILGDSDINSIRYCEPHGILRRSVNNKIQFPPDLANNA